MKFFFRTIHLFLSLVSGIFIMMACFTGSILVFEEDLQHSIYHDRYFVQQQGELQLPVGSVLANLKKEFPEARSADTSPRQFLSPDGKGRGCGSRWLNFFFFLNNFF